MYEWAMNIWNMSADGFQDWLIIVLIVAFFVYEAIVEINTNRIKRFTKK